MGAAGNMNGMGMSMGPGMGRGPRGPGFGPDGPMGPPSNSATTAAPFTPEVAAACERALQSERLAEATYAKAFAPLQGPKPFKHIANAEERHAWAIENLYRARGLPVPTTDTSNVPAYKSLKDACAGGVATEKANVAMYDELLKIDALPADVRTVFEHLRLVSSSRHLPAFQACD